MTSNNPNIRPLGDGFFNDITRGYKQKAAYASFDFDLIPQRADADRRHTLLEYQYLGSRLGRGQFC